MFAYAPVIAGDWQQHEVWDTYTFKDLLDWHEMHDVKVENEKRYAEYQEIIKGNNGR